MGAYQPSIGLGVPNQDASQGPSLLLGQLVEINTNILVIYNNYILRSMAHWQYQV